MCSCSVFDENVKQLEKQARLAFLYLDEILALLDDEEEQGDVEEQQEEEEEEAEDEEEEEQEEKVMAKQLQEDEQDKKELSELANALKWDTAILVEKKHLEKRWADKVGA